MPYLIKKNFQFSIKGKILFNNILAYFSDQKMIFRNGIIGKKEFLAKISHIFENFWLILYLFRSFPENMVNIWHKIGKYGIITSAKI